MIRFSFVLMLVACVGMSAGLVFAQDDAGAGTASNKVPEGPPLFKTIEGAKTYIVQHQNRDGGWPPGPRWRQQCGKYCVCYLGID